MKAYPEYKESGYDWIGDIPEHWKMVQLKFIAPRKTEQTEDVKGFGFQIALENIESKTGKILGSGSFEGLGNIFRKDDVLFNKLRPYLCKVVIAPNDGVAVSELLVLRPREDIENRFLFYRLLESKFISVVDGSTYGAKMPRANWDFIGNLKIPTPSLPEQQAIADFLDRKTAQIDTLIEKKQRQIDLLQEQRTALINHAVTQGLNPNVRMKDSGVEWLGEIPSHWRNVRLKFLTREIIDTEHKTAPFYDGGDYFVVRTSNIKNGKLIFENAKYTNSAGYEEWTKRGVPDPGDVIFTREAPAGEACIVPDNLPIVIGQRTVLIRLKKELFDAEFCIWSIYGGETSQFIKLLSQGSTVAHFNMADIRDMPFLVPPLEEQKSISSFITSATKRIDSGIDEIISQINNLKEYRTALISEAVTGKIDVRTAETVHESPTGTM